MMKMKMKNLAAMVAFGILPGAAFAGTMSKEVIEEPVCAVPFSGSVSAGYESTYLFRGVDFGDHAPWTGIDLNTTVLGQDVNFGAWYINPTKRPVDFDELDLYAFIAGPSFGPISTSFGGTWFYFAEQSADAGELELDLSMSLFDFADLTLINVYDMTIEGWYWELALGKTIPLTSCLGLNLGTGVSYGDKYYGVSSFNHAYATIGLDYALTETATFSIYAGGNFPLEDLSDAGEDDDLHGGASISVSF